MATPDHTDTPLNELISLSGRVAVVTGAAKGIGLAVATRFAEAGADVMLADLDETLASEQADRLASTFGVQARGVSVDVSQPDQVDAVADRAVSELGRLDIWANIAGIYPVKPDDFQPGAEMTDDTWARTMRINLDGSFH